MDSKIVAISVEKIQKYIYQRIDDMTSQGLNDNNTLSSVRIASGEVRNGIIDKIKNIFEEKKIDIEEFILKVSGKYIFKVKIKDDREEELKNCLKNLFEEVYRKYEGHLFLKYKYFNDEKIEDKIEYIKEANEYLKSSEVKSEIIEENKNIIFNFMKLEKRNENQKMNKAEDDFELEEKVFASNLDCLAPINKDYKRGNTNDTKTRGKIAIVKADINNMGSIFEKIDSYDKYQDLSRLLEKTLNMKSFSEKVKEIGLENEILPFYIEGDDIFFAVKIGGLLKSVKLLNSWIRELREEIENKKIGDEINIAISVGATFVDNHQPIRYYRKVVEQELSTAKYKMKKEKVDKATLGVSISGVSLFCYIGDKGKGESDGFYNFERKIQVLNLFKGNLKIDSKKLFEKEKIYSNSYFYNLLYSIEHEKDNKHQIRILLYKLLPNITGEIEQKKTDNDEKKLERIRKDKQKRNYNEIYFKNYLINQIMKKEDEDKGKGNSINSEKIKNNLIPKLKLFILLTDERYIEKMPIEDILKVKGEIYSSFKTNKNIKKFKSVLFDMSLDYLYKEIEKKEILKLFVKEIKDEEKINKNNKNNKRSSVKLGYKKANFQLSFFYRIKSIIEMKEDKKTKIELVTKMFENMSKIIKENELRIINEDKEKNNNEKEKKINYRLDFKFNNFVQLIKNEAENTDWIDILILFYSYSQQKVKYVNIYQPKKSKK